MSNIQTINCQKDTHSFDTVIAARTMHSADCEAFTTISDYDTWVGTQLFTETYTLIPDKSGYVITRVWPTEAAKDAAVAESGEDFDSMSIGTSWIVNIHPNPA
mgnify:CR=1 FL=1